MPNSTTVVESIMKTMQLFFPCEDDALLGRMVYQLIQVYEKKFDQTDEIFEFSVVWLSQFSCLQEVQQAIDTDTLDIWLNDAIFGETRVEWDAVVQNSIDEANYDSKDVTFACMRCNSTQVTVTTAQIRAADEGMTEFRNCRNCGFMSRINS